MKAASHRSVITRCLIALGLMLNHPQVYLAECNEGGAEEISALKHAIEARQPTYADGKRQYNSGLASIVTELSPGSKWVAKTPRHKDSDSVDTLNCERKTMQWLIGREYRVPHLGSGSSPDRIVMEHVYGDTMDDIIAKHGMNTTLRHNMAQTLGRLHIELHRITGAPTSLCAEDIVPKASLRVLHWDFTPKNVIIPRDGSLPVVIDWESASTGNEHKAYLQIASTAVRIISEDEGQSMFISKARETFVAAFLNSFPLEAQAKAKASVRGAAALTLSTSTMNSEIQERHLEEIVGSGNIFADWTRVGHQAPQTTTSYLEPDGRRVFLVKKSPGWWVREYSYAEPEPGQVANEAKGSSEVRNFSKEPS